MTSRARPSRSGSVMDGAASLLPMRMWTTRSFRASPRPVVSKLGAVVGRRRRATNVCSPPSRPARRYEERHARPPSEAIASLRGRANTIATAQRTHAHKSPTHISPNSVGRLTSIDNSDNNAEGCPNGEADSFTTWHPRIGSPDPLLASADGRADESSA